jgi:hypothetical protein
MAVLLAAVAVWAAALLWLCGDQAKAVTDTQRETITVTASGVDGSATGIVTSTNVVRGHIQAVHVDYTAGISSTTDITLTTISPLAKILSLAEGATDGWYYPSVKLCDSDGSAVTFYDQPWVDDRMMVEAAETTSGTVVIVTVMFEP